MKPLVVPLQNLRIEMTDGGLVVTEAETGYAVTYYRPEDSPLLVARNIVADGPRDAAKLREFLGRAWWAASEKARELGWIV